MGANPNPKLIGLEKLKGISNYFIGNDPKKWRTNVPNYARVMVKDVYPGIDQIFYGRESGVGSRESGELEFDFVVHPGADPKAIRLVAETQNWKLENGKWKLVTGNRQLATAPNGDLVLQTDTGEVRLGKPVVYQTGGQKSEARSQNSQFRVHNSEVSLTPDTRYLAPLNGHYQLTAQNQITFTVPGYDRARTLVIDPALNYLATFGGGAKSQGEGIAADSAGNAYVVGLTESADFPTTPGAFQASCTPDAGGYCNHAVVRKIDSSGAAVYSTYLGGSTTEQGFGIAVDSSGDAYVTGWTLSVDFPTLNAFQPTYSGGLCGDPTNPRPCEDAFVTEINPTGSSLVYSSYLGGTGDDAGGRITVDAAGNAYITGQTASSDFPTTANAFQTVFGGGQCVLFQSTTRPCNDAFVTKVAPGGSELAYSTYLGGNGDDYAGGIAVDPAGNAYVTGSAQSFDFPVLKAFQPACVPQVVNGATYCNDAFVAELDPSGSTLHFSTYLGGSGTDEGQGIALDPAGNIYIAGQTDSTDFPVANAVQPSYTVGLTSFVTEFNPGASQLIYSTYFLGTASWGIAVDSVGEAYITGQTGGSMSVVNAFQPTYGGGSLDAFVAAFQAGGQGLIYSTYLGGDGQDQAFGIAVDGAGDAWVTGASNSTTFVAAITRPEVVHRDVAPGPAPRQSTSGVTQALAGSIALDMARVKAAPASLDFGAEVVGVASAPDTLTISNPGTAPLTFSGISASDSFAVPSGGNCTTSSAVPVGGNCTVDVAFAPTVGGTLTGTLTLTDNGIGSPHSVPLSGTGQDFTLVTNPSSATLKAGVTATVLLSVAPQGGFNHPLDLSCDDPAPHSTCSINPASVTPNPQFGSTVAVSITTTASSQAAPRMPNGPWLGPWAHSNAPLRIALAMLALLAAASRRRLARRWAPTNKGAAAMRTSPLQFPRFALAFALLLVLAWAACGGGTAGTPPGTYTVTLKVADMQANLSHTTTVTLTVQ